MKLIFCLGIFFLGLIFSGNAQPGKYAGSKKWLIGKDYVDSHKISGLAGWKFMEGSLITDINDPGQMTADVFKKSSTYLVLFSVKEDTADEKFYIADVLEVRNVLTSQTIHTGTCSEGANETIDIVALTKNQNNVEFSKAIKAWRLNRDKR